MGVHSSKSKDNWCIFGDQLLSISTANGEAVSKNDRRTALYAHAPHYLRPKVVGTSGPR